MIQAKESRSAGERLVEVVGSALLAVMLFAAGLLVPPPGQACYDQTVRDASFGYPRDMHLMAVVAGDDDPRGEEIYNYLEQWFEDQGRGLNIELRRVDPDDPDVRWEELGIPSAPPSSPVAVLAGRGAAWVGRPNFLIDHWEPGPDAEDLKVLKSSPAREEIRREVARRLAVLIHIPGSDSERGSVDRMLESVVEAWSEREPLGVGIVRVDRSDERERLLLSFMGAGNTDSDLVGVVFGRGKMMPPLKGEDISEARLNGLLEPLVGDCSCLQSPYALGVDMPLEWDETRDAAVVALRSDILPGAWGILSATMWTLGGLVVLVVLATVWIMRKRGV